MFGRRPATSGNGKVIQLERFLGGVSLSPLRQIEAYWTALRESGEIPVRSQIDPRGLSAALEYTFILERIAPGVARFRIAGQHLCRLAGMEVRGMPLTAFFTPASRNRTGALLERVFDAPSAAEVDLRAEPVRGNAGLTARMLMLPLRSDAGRIDRVLGGVMTSDRGAPKSTPLRFDIAGVEFRDIDAGPGPAPRAEPEATEPPGFAESPAPLKGAPYLRLVKTDSR